MGELAVMRRNTTATERPLLSSDIYQPQDSYGHCRARPRRLMSATIPANALEAFRAYDRNLRWAKAHEEVLAPFEEKYVAVADGKVVGSAATKEALQPKVKGHVGVYVAYVAKK